jgi:hypothetical protein
MSKLTKVMLQRRDLLSRYAALRAQLAEVVGRLDALPLVGKYPPNAFVGVCGKCGEGPFNAREIRQHRARCKGKT